MHSTTDHQVLCPLLTLECFQIVTRTLLIPLYVLKLSMHSGVPSNYLNDAFILVVPGAFYCVECARDITEYYCYPETYTVSYLSYMCNVASRELTPLVSDIISKSLYSTTMPYHALPEELLLDILKIYFHTQTSLLDFFTEDHEAWEYTHLSPNDRFPSHLLLVCKQWTRIITPLLYANVLLRSDDDVALFARTLTENRALGPLVRNLRLDGGYARQLGEVAKHLPAVRGLAIELQMLSKTTVSGLFKAMSLFDPTDVYLHSVTRPRENQKSVDVARRVYDQLPKWKSLVRESQLSQLIA